MAITLKGKEKSLPEVELKRETVTMVDLIFTAKQEILDQIATEIDQTFHPFGEVDPVVNCGWSSAGLYGEYDTLTCHTDPKFVDRVLAEARKVATLKEEKS